MKDRTQTVRLGIPATRKRSCTSEIEDRTKTESVDVWSFIEQVASLSWNLAWNQPVCRERVVKGLLSKLMAKPRYDELGVKLMDRTTIRLQKGDPGWLNGIQIFLQMSDVEKFPLRYSLCWVSDPPPGVASDPRLETRRYDVPLQNWNPCSKFVSFTGVAATKVQSKSIPARGKNITEAFVWAMRHWLW